MQTCEMTDVRREKEDRKPETGDRKGNRFSPYYAFPIFASVIHSYHLSQILRAFA
jgi:hypothetical protein